MSAPLSPFARFPFSREIAGFLACTRGVTAVEFAFVSPIIIAIVLATLQVGVIFVAQSYLDLMAEDAMRTVMTNNANVTTAATFQAQVCANLTAMFDCNSIIVELQPAPSGVSGMSAALPQFDSHGNLIGTPTVSSVAAPSKMILVLMYQWPIITGPLGFNFAGLGNGKYLLVSTMVFQEEPPQI